MAMKNTPFGVYARPTKLLTLLKVDQVSIIDRYPYRTKRGETGNGLNDCFRDIARA